MVIYKLVAMSDAFFAPHSLFPVDREPNDYYDSVVANSKIVLSKAKSLLRGCLAEFSSENFFVSTTGSDGREEKSNYSKVELMLFYTQKLSTENQMLIQDKLRALCVEYPSLFSADIEVRNLSVDDPLKFASSSREEVFFPTRCLDAVLLCGNSTVFDDYKKSLLSLNSKKIAEFKSRRFDIPKNILLHKGIQVIHGEEIQHFDLDSGVVFYSKSNIENRTTRGTKHGHLRAVQYKVGLIIFKAIRDKKVTEESLFELPSGGIVSRLHYLFDNNLLSITKDQLSKLIDSYKYCLHLYHLSEHFSKTFGLDSISVDPLKFQQHSNVICDFIKGL